ncbi:MAG: hypothetical protein R6W74_06905 [Nitrosomonas halophila]
MEKKTRGAWIIHHTQKIHATTSQEFEAIDFAGKCGTLLSAMTASGQEQVPISKVNAFAKANSVNPRTEVPTILAELERQRLVQRGDGAVEVLGLTSHSVLEHTATIYDESDRESKEDAVIELSDIASESPVTDCVAIEMISDQFQIPSREASEIILLGTGLKFFDSEPLSSNENMLFNGNLFRRNDARKINAVLGSLSANEVRLVNEVRDRLDASGCLPLVSVNTVLGDVLFKKLHSIGMFDLNVVGNESGKHAFVTRPAAFSKFTNSMADDALDLAKAFVASLTYGMTLSDYYRGRIQVISALMNKLISGGEVGPATAIGSDYQALEFKGVVKVTPAQGGMFTMRLMKPDVGRLALSVIEHGNLTAESIAQIPGARVTEYMNPERTREIVRKDCTDAVKRSARNLLNEIRTGGLSA